MADFKIESNKRHSNYSFSIKLKRIFWSIVRQLFLFSPRTFFGWRNFLLRTFGAKIGKDVHIYNSAIIYFPWNLTVGNHSTIGEGALIYNLGKIIIGHNTTISQRAHLCAGTHDYTRMDMPLIKPPITIRNKVWICADAFIGPNVIINEGAVIAARAVVIKDVEAWSIIGGNPAKFIKMRVIKS